MGLEINKLSLALCSFFGDESFVFCLNILGCKVVHADESSKLNMSYSRFMEYNEGSPNATFNTHISDNTIFYSSGS